MRGNSLTAQIKHAERQVLRHKQSVRVSTNKLINTVHQQMTAPSTLLLASVIGFMLAEVTRQQNPDKAGSPDKPRKAATSPIITMLNLMISMHTLYTALPLAWLMETFDKPQTSTPANKKQ